MTLWILHLEPLPERYTEQWYRWFDKYGKENQISQEFVEGEILTTKVEVGTVLDAVGTNYWKMTQLANFASLWKQGRVKSGDKILTFDLWHPGLEIIPYMAQLTGIEVDLYGFLHAGSYTFMDFAEPMSPWARYFERGWVAICDKVFVGSEYHKKVFSSYRLDETNGVRDLLSPNKIVVTGNPLDTQEVRNLAGVFEPLSKREKIIIYPHRFDTEKNPKRFMDLMDQLWLKRQDFKVIFTTSRESFRSNDQSNIDRLSSCKFPYEIKVSLTKAEYYEFMALAKVFVSTTREENFGYCLAEALTLGTFPIVEDAYSHPELVNQVSNYLYKSSEEALAKIELVLDGKFSDEFHQDTVQYVVNRYSQSIDRIYKEMGC